MVSCRRRAATMFRSSVNWWTTMMMMMMVALFPTGGVSRSLTVAWRLWRNRCFVIVVVVIDCVMRYCRRVAAAILILSPVNWWEHVGAPGRITLVSLSRGAALPSIVLAAEVLRGQPYPHTPWEVCFTSPDGVLRS